MQYVVTLRALTSLYPGFTPSPCCTAAPSTRSLRSLPDRVPPPTATHGSRRSVRPRPAARERNTPPAVPAAPGDTDRHAPRRSDDAAPPSSPTAETPSGAPPQTSRCPPPSAASPATGPARPTSTPGPAARGTP